MARVTGAARLRPGPPGAPPPSPGFAGQRWRPPRPRPLSPREPRAPPGPSAAPAGWLAQPGSLRGNIPGVGRRPGRARRVPCGAPDPRRLRRRPCARTAGTGSRRPSCKRFRLMALLLHKCLPPGQPGLSLRPLCLKKGRVRLQKAPGPSKRGGATPGRRVGERPSRPWAFWRAGGRHPQRRPQKHLSPGDPSPSVSGRPRPPTHPGNGGGGGCVAAAGRDTLSSRRCPLVDWCLSQGCRDGGGWVGVEVERRLGGAAAQATLRGYQCFRTENRTFPATIMRCF